MYNFLIISLIQVICFRTRVWKFAVSQSAVIQNHTSFVCYCLSFWTEQIGYISPLLNTLSNYRSWEVIIPTRLKYRHCSYSFVLQHICIWNLVLARNVCCYRCNSTFSFNRRSSISGTVFGINSVSMWRTAYKNYKNDASWRSCVTDKGKSYPSHWLRLINWSCSLILCGY